MRAEAGADSSSKRTRIALAFVALALAACTSPTIPTTEAAPARTVEQRPSADPAPRGATLLRRTMLAAHDAARAEVGVPPLDWNDRLAAAARTYAQDLARTGRFEHARQPHGPARQGENLWTGTRDAYAYDEMIGHWIAERRDFTGGVTPMFSRTGRWQDVAHYTQIVWRRTTAVGCATASNARDDYLVCRYAPAGNVVGERVF